MGISLAKPLFVPLLQAMQSQTDYDMARRVWRGNAGQYREGMLPRLLVPEVPCATTTTIPSIT